MLRPRLATSLLDEGEDGSTVLDGLAAALEPGLVATAGPRYFGFVTGGVLPAALGADWLVSAVDQNAAAHVMSPAAAVVEQITAGWVLELLGLPPGSAVGFVTGGQMANFSCLAAARHALLAGEGWDVEADGLAGAPVPTVFVGARAHSTVFQALRLLGLGSSRAQRVPTDEQGRMSPGELRAALATAEGPALVCAQAGEVNTGAVDPLAAIADVVGEHGRAWLHIDGAFGLWAAASPQLRPLVAGAERADSWAVDGHKWLNVPYDRGMAIVADPAAASGGLDCQRAVSRGGLRRTGHPRPVRLHAGGVPAGQGRAGVRSTARPGPPRSSVSWSTAAAPWSRQAADQLARCPRVEVLNEGGPQPGPVPRARRRHRHRHRAGAARTGPAGSAAPPGTTSRPSACRCRTGRPPRTTSPAPSPRSPPRSSSSRRRIGERDARAGLRDLSSSMRRTA